MKRSEPCLQIGDSAYRQQVLAKYKNNRTNNTVFILKNIGVMLIALIAFVAIWAGLNAINNWVDVQMVSNVQAQEAPQVSIKQYPKVTAQVTAYTSSVDETDDTPFITASGARTGHGVIACPSKYAFGTVVEIEGRRFTCEDRMNKRYRETERFDIWMETKSEAYAWGIKTLEVKIIEENA